MRFLKPADLKTIEFSSREYFLDCIEMTKAFLVDASEKPRFKHLIFVHFLPPLDIPPSKKRVFPKSKNVMPRLDRGMTVFGFGDALFFDKGI